MLKIFTDSDVILDVLAKRDPFYNNSSEVLSLVENKKIIAFTSPIVIANIFYILRKLKSKEFALESLRKLKLFMKVIPVEETHIDKALAAGFKDFEDAIQYYASMDKKLEFIITKNKEDYKLSKISVCTPAEFLNIYYSGK